MVALAADLPERARDRVDRALTDPDLKDTGDNRDRLSSLSPTGRVEHWRAALRGSASSRVAGTGAGTFALVWAEGRTSEFDVTEAHSLYVEVLAELGVVGLLALLAVLLAVLLALAWRARGRERSA